MGILETLYEASDCLLVFRTEHSIFFKLILPFEVAEISNCK